MSGTGRRRTRTHYMVRWKGYDRSHDSLEPEQNLSNAQAAVAEYFAGTPTLVPWAQRRRR